MLDFYHIEEEEKKTGREYTLVIKPEFDLVRTKDLMIRGGDFYAVYDDESGLWSTDEQTVIDKVDESLELYRKNLEHPERYDKIVVKYMRRASSGTIDDFHRYVKERKRDTYHITNQKVMPINTTPKRNDFATFQLPWALEPGDISAYKEAFSILFDEENLQRAEWSFGSIIDGASRHIQKFAVFYGPPKSGKSSLLGVFEDILTLDKEKHVGYVSTWNSKSMGGSDPFATDSFKNNPLLSIQNDGNLSHIEDNALLNSVVSHEMVGVNPKYGKRFDSRFNTFLMLGTNKPVQITDAKSGLLRRLIDIRPTGNRIPRGKYDQLMEQIKFEHGAIAYHCLQVFRTLGESYYDDYVPIEMMEETNNFYNYLLHYYDDFVKKDCITRTEAWKRYCEYCEFAGCYRMEWKSFGNELKNYFETYQERARINGVQKRSLYSGFRTDKFAIGKEMDSKDESYIPEWLEMNEVESKFDEVFSDWPAQYEKDYGKGPQPEFTWAKCKTRLCDLDTKQVHYTKPPENVVILMADFDLKDENGNKSLELNLKEAQKWPKTYAELSKSGGGIHLYYFYDGDISKLRRLYAQDIEIKAFTGKGKAAIRRKLTFCNAESIATLPVGTLPMKGDGKKKVDWDGYKDAKHLHNHLLTEIKRNLGKEVHADTTSSIHLIKKILDEAYESGITYNLTNVRIPELSKKKTIPELVLDFAANSTNQKDHCVECVAEMHFKSEDQDIEDHTGDIEEPDKKTMIVLDTEIYRPDEETNNEGLFLICWKVYGSDPSDIHVMVNPSSEEVESILQYSIIGFNCRDYDNHMLYAASLGMDNAGLYDLSYRIINLHDQNAKYGAAYNISTWDVYEYCKAAGKAQGLKKWEIELGISHIEMGIPWDQPAPKDRWNDIIEYCKNDVIATERVFDATKGYRLAREFQVNLVKALHGNDISVTTNDTANTLSKRAIFGKNRKPQSQFNYRNLAEPVGSDRYEEYLEKFGPDYQFRVWNEKGLPEYRDYIPGEVLPKGWSILPFFPGYTFDQYAKKSEMSTFHGDHGGEGGRNYSVRGMYTNVWDGDIASQYPHSIMAEVLFGPEYTKIFAEIVKARIAVKHKDFATAGELLDGALKPFLSEDTAGDLAQGMKIIINAVYGLTKAGFVNEFRDPKNLDNIVAKRGNLFMLVLKEQIEKRGYRVVHIKTDSIKIENAGDDIMNFVIAFGKEYGYSFETEGWFSKFVLMNDSSYVAFDKNVGWITKATQMQEPYVRKTLFTREPVVFADLCHTFSVQEGALYLDMNEDLPDVEPLEKELELLKKDLNRGKIRKGYHSAYDMERAISSLEDEIKDGHRLQFVGRVGRFCPVISGTGGGVLYRVQDGKNYAAAGSTGYRWLEAEYVLEYDLEKNIDMSYFAKLVDDAAEAIGELGDLEWFLDNDISDFPLNPPIYVSEDEDDEVPFEE